MAKKKVKKETKKSSLELLAQEAAAMETEERESWFANYDGDDKDELLDMTATILAKLSEIKEEVKEEKEEKKPEYDACIDFALAHESKGNWNKAKYYLNQARAIADNKDEKKKAEAMLSALAKSEENAKEEAKKEAKKSKRASDENLKADLESIVLRLKEAGAYERSRGFSNLKYSNAARKIERIIRHVFRR